jgi:hypothetical protein
MEMDNVIYSKSIRYTHTFALCIHACTFYAPLQIPVAVSPCCLTYAAHCVQLDTSESKPC